MIGFLSVESYKKRDRLDINSLNNNMNIISKMNDRYSNYVKSVYKEYKEFLKNENIDIKEELLSNSNITEITINDIDKCECIISPSHLNTYHIIKRINSNKKELTVICFDMHCDTYDFGKLWKGNTFSKLIKEGYVSYLVVVGVPRYKQKNTWNDVPNEIKNKVYIVKRHKFFNILSRINTKRLFISIDADVLDTRKSKYTAIDYSPFKILYLVSKLDSNVINEEIVKNCVLVPNDLGYENLYRVGENNLSVKKLVSIILKLKKFCNKNMIKMGVNSLYGDITEIEGNDYNYRTFNAIIKLLTFLGGETNEKTIH